MKDVKSNALMVAVGEESGALGATTKSRLFTGPGGRVDWEG